ncbi:MAG: hypothetical protein O2877_00575 [bacterium]|nr:hypothetical protein [bacterium]
MNEHRRIPEGISRAEGATPSLFETANTFVAGDILAGAAVVHEGEESNIYRILKRSEPIPEIPGASLRLDYRRYHEEGKNRWDQLRFEYTVGEDEQEVHIAEMHLGVIKKGTFGLEHRYVQPKQRNKSGLGTRLLKSAEEWVQQVANASQQDQTIMLQTGQLSVLDWLNKQGYSATERFADLMKEIEEHPEHFFEAEVILSKESSDQGIVKDLYLFRNGEEGRYMEDAIRLTFAKTFKPE